MHPKSKLIRLVRPAEGLENEILLDHRTYNVLVRHGISTWGKLITTSPFTLLMCKGMGRKSLRVVLDVIRDQLT